MTSFQLNGNSDKVIMSFNPALDGAASAIDIFETGDLSPIWKSDKYSIWKPVAKQNFYTVTHHVGKGKIQPGIGFIMKADQDTVAIPESYTLIKKTEKGKDSDNNDAHAYIFSVNCPSGKRS